MFIPTLKDPGHAVRDALIALWHGMDGGTPQGFADDAVIVDAAFGQMSLRSFAALRQAVRQSIPDHSILVEDSVCHGDGQRMIVVSRLCAIGTQSGHGPFGPPTHRPVIYRMMAESLIEGERIVQVRLIRDRAGFLVPGQDASCTAARAAQPGPALHSGDPWASAFAELLGKMMDGDFSVLHRAYERGAELYHPRGQVRSGRLAAEGFWLGIRAAFPSAALVIQSSIGQEPPLASPRVAIGWRLSGRHDGWGRYGAPTGAEVQMDGITFAEFGPAGVRREWTIIDDLAIQAQIASRLTVQSAA